MPPARDGHQSSSSGAGCACAAAPHLSPRAPLRHITWPVENQHQAVSSACPKMPTLPCSTRRSSSGGSSSSNGALGSTKPSRLSYPGLSEMFAYHATTMANTIRTSLLVFSRKVD